MNKHKTSIFVIFCFFLLVSFSKINAQDNFKQKVDSLQYLIANSPNDTLKVWIYSDLSKTLQRQNHQSEMLKIAEKGLALSKKLDYPKGITQMILHKATALDIMGQPDKALPLFNEGLKMAKIQGEKEVEAKYYLNIGVCHYYAGDLDLALKNYLLAYDLEEGFSKKGLAKLLNNIGVIYRHQKRYERAAALYLKSYELKQELGDSLGMATSLMNLGLVYYRIEGKEEMAIENLQRSQNLNQLLGRPYDVASCNTSLGEIFLGLNNIPKAKEALKKAWAFFEKNISVEYSPGTLGLLSNLAIEEKDYETAEVYLVKALELVTTFDQKKNQSEILFSLSNIKNKLGKNDQAYKMLKKAYALNDTLTQTLRLEAMEEMQAKFDVKEKDNKLEFSRLKLNERTRQRNIFLFGAIGLALFALTIFFFLRNQIRANKKIMAQTEEIHAQKIAELQQRNKLQALNSMIEGQEAERIRIAKDLHDSLGGLLSTVKAHFTTFQNEIKQLEKMNLAEKTNELIDEACVEVRRISHNMIPHALTLSGLPTVLEDMAESLRNAGFEVDLDIRGFPDQVSQTKLAMLYRLVQEVISNIRKHAKARTVLIQIFGLEKGISLIVEDDGVGFDYDKAVVSEGVGLKSINSRVEFLDGIIDWDASLGNGTTITINIPVI